MSVEKIGDGLVMLSGPFNYGKSFLPKDFTKHSVVIARPGEGMSIMSMIKSPLAGNATGLLASLLRRV